MPDTVENNPSNSAGAGDGIDIPTVIAIAALAYTLSNMTHEALGHGGAAVLLGARPTMLNAIFLNYDEATVSETARRWISASGSIADLLVGLPALALVPRARSTRWRYFLWLFAAVNILTAFGYLLYSGVAGIGDWSRVFAGLAPEGLIRAVLIAAGAALYFIVAPRLLAPRLDPFLGREPGVRERRARLLSLLPYLAGSVSLAVAGILNPLGWKILLISAVAAGFGGTSLLAWYFTIPRKPAPDTAEPPLGLPRSTAWIAAAGVVLLFFVFVLGPGIGSLDQ
ncbi:MAG TPA: hypothetical protein VFQ07_04415 [Candidatus Polarisedimenticolia bacterium]|nr:hypothetical protein [Candidatus Polarisedimenticolia bacterium]